MNDTEDSGPNNGQQRLGREEEANSHDKLSNAEIIAELLQDAGQVRTLSADGLLDQRPLPGSLNSPAFFVAMLCLFSGLYWWSPWAEYLVASRGEVLSLERPWLLITGILAHADIAHLSANSGLFLLFAWLLRGYIGVLAFPYLALVAGILTQIISLLSYQNRVVLLGASGMVYAMAGMWLCYYLFCERRLSLKRKSFRILGFAMIVLLPTQIQAQVSYRAHAIGFAIGVFVALLSTPLVIRMLRQRLDENKSTSEPQ